GPHGGERPEPLDRFRQSAKGGGAQYRTDRRASPCARTYPAEEAGGVAPYFPSIGVFRPGVRVRPSKRGARCRTANASRPGSNLTLVRWMSLGHQIREERR